MSAPSRGLHYVSAAIIGAGLGVLLYRFAVLGLFWQGTLRWIFPAIGTGAIVGGFKLLDGHDSTGVAVLPRIVSALAGIGAAMGLLFVFVPPLSHIELHRRELPGFSIDLPEGEPSKTSADYATGQVLYKNVGGANAVVGVTWETGAATMEELETAASVLAKELGGNATTRSTMPGPDGAPIDTISFDTDKGLPLRMSRLPCGARTMYVMSIGIAGIDAVHGRILASFRCSPDPAQDASPPGLVRIALDLPGWWAEEKLPMQVTLTDDTAFVMVRDGITFDQDLEKLVAPLLNAYGGNVTHSPRIADRIPFSGTIEGEHVEGWAKTLACPRWTLLILVMTSTAERLDEVTALMSSARCSRDGETPQSWPDRPAPPAE